MLHGRGQVSVRGEQVFVRLDSCERCRGRRGERLLRAACAVFAILTFVEFVLLLAEGLLAR